MEDKIISVIENLEAFTSKMAEPAFDAVVQGMWLKSVALLGVGGFFVVVVAVCVIALAHTLKLDQEGLLGNSIADGLRVVGPTVIGFLSALSILGTLFNVYNWIGAFDPVARLALKLVE